MKEKVILAYSGGLDTSVIIPWLKENYDYEVIAVSIDVGQGKELTGLREKALASGASKVYIEDAKEEFIESYLFPMLKSGAYYEGKYLMGTLSRPLIAQKLAEVAKKEKAVAIVHGATGKGNDQVRFEIALKYLAPEVKIIAPWRIWDIRSRDDAIEYAKERNIPITATREKPYSEDRNIWYMSHEGGILEDPGQEAPGDLYELTVGPEKAQDKVEHVEIEFSQGVPISVNGVRMKSIDLVEHLNKLGARNGIGIVDMVENRLVGMKSRGVYECPGGTILYEAHEILESICLDRDMAHYKSKMSIDYAGLIYDGKWFTPLRESMAAFIDKTQETVTGVVKLKLYKGNCMPAGVQSEYSLYEEKLATFGKDEIYNQKDAEGFINLYGLSAKVKALNELKRSQLDKKL